MPGYADVEDPIAVLNTAPDVSGGPTVEEAIEEAGFQVQMVNWVWEQIVGESLVESIIMPITGDFEKIHETGAQWENVCDALQAIRNNLNSGLEELAPNWHGPTSEKFQNLIGTIWTAGIEADAQAAKLIKIALHKVAEGSKRACDEALNLIRMLVNKLIEAAAMLPIPVVGWGRAVKLVYDGIQLYNAIMRLIRGIQAIIEGAQQVIEGIQQVGSAIAKIKDINSLNDLINAGNEAGEGIANVKGGAESVKGGLGDVKGGATEAAGAASSAKDNATGLRDERAAARADTTPSGADGSGTTGADGRGRDGSGTRGRGANDGSMAANAGDPNTEGRPRECVPGSGDPVDLATGQMFMSQTDLELPGILPLVLERTHFSGYRVGRWFGRSWASTLDQRLEVESDAVYFAGADGARLRFPLPAEGATVFPETGSRWGLTRSGDEYTLTQPREGRALHFRSGASRRRLTAISDRNGNRIEFGYHPDTGAPTEIRHSGGYHVGIDSANGVVTRLWLHNPGGTPITLQTFGYNDADRLVEVINSSGAAMRFDYDTAGRITQWTDRNGEWYRYHYDDNGRVTSSDGSGSALTGRWAYDDAARTRTFTNALGHTTSYAFNERWQPVSETDALGHTATMEWNSFNQVLARTDTLGRVTRYDYDADGNLLRLTRTGGASRVAEYNDLGLATRIVDPDGAVWLREYDTAGNMIAVTDPAGARTSYAYNERGGLVSITDAQGGMRRVATDAMGLPVAVTDPLGTTTRYLRDVFGRVHTVTDPAGGRLRMAWTVEGQLLSRTTPDGATERWRYDGEGNLLEHTDTLGQVTRTEYGHFDLPIAQTGPDGARLEFGYDPELRLVSVTNPQSLVWRYTYDAAGNLVSETDFNGRTLHYEHDEAGQLVARVNGAGERVTFTRDPLGNVIQKRCGEVVTTFQLDPAGRMLRATAPDADVVFQRDPLGRVLTETVNGRTLKSTFDALGRRVSRVTPSGAESTWTYDANDRPTSLTSGGQTLRFGYNAAGREINRQIGAGTLLTQSWDAGHRLTGQRLTASNPYTAGGREQLVQQRTYNYRPDGYLLGVDDHLGGSRRYELDPAGRITAVHGQGWTERYAYDSAGNITAAGWPAAPDGSGVPEAQGPREYTGTLIRRAGNTVYQHDAQGRVAQRRRRTLSGQHQTWTFTWDAEDRLTGVSTPDGARWRYVYDPLGRRIAKQRLDPTGQVAEHVAFAWDGVNLAEQTTTGPSPDGINPGQSSITVWDFEPGTFRPLTQTEFTPSGPRWDQDTADAPQEWIDQRFYALITDLVGTPTEMVDPNGGLAWRSHTTIWGQALGRLTSSLSRPNCPLRFPGQYHDPETGDNYNYFRYYDPAGGRYASLDPLGLKPGPNPNTYVHNPSRLLDPLGLTPTPGGCGTGSHTNPPPPQISGPISMDQAVDLGAQHVGGSGQMVQSGSGGHQFISHSTDAAGQRVTSIARFDINPSSPHVQQYGPHLNLETQVGGRPVQSGAFRDPHIAIDPSTIRPGDIP